MLSICAVGAQFHHHPHLLKIPTTYHRKMPWGHQMHICPHLEMLYPHQLLKVYPTIFLPPPPRKHVRTYLPQLPLKC